MKLDERDEQLGALLDDALGGLRLPTGDPRAAMHQGDRRRGAVIVASIATVVLFLGAVGVASTQFGRDAVQPGRGAQGPPSQAIAPLSFAPADAWDSQAHGRTHPVDLSAAWTSNEPIDPRDQIPIEPHASITSLPPEGIFIDAWEVVPGELPDPNNPNFSVAKLPLTLPDEVSSNWEGFVPGIGRSTLWAQVNGRYIQIWIFYGTTDPSMELRAQAQLALDRLVVEPARDGQIYTDEQDGFSVTVPEGWLVAPEPINTWVASPREILAMATYPLRPGGEAVVDIQLPSHAIDDLGPNDMLIWLNEAGTGSGFPPRPERFAPSTPCEGWSRLCPEPTGTDVWSGLDHPPDTRGWWLGFHDNGRGFYVFVGMGNRAFENPDRAREVWDVLDTLAVDPS
jgi:hypothetical protein